LSGRRGEAHAGVWGGTPSLTPKRETNKRANSPQGYEASGKTALLKSAYNPPPPQRNCTRAETLLLYQLNHSSSSPKPPVFAPAALVNSFELYKI